MWFQINSVVSRCEPAAKAVMLLVNLLQVNITTVKPFWEVTLKILETLASKQQ